MSRNIKTMSNVRTISQEDLDKYPSLKGKKVGDTITAEEDAKLREGKADKASKEVDSASDIKATPPTSSAKKK
jgi:hypothetical protein